MKTSLALTQPEQPDLFVCNLATWQIKDDMASMDIPIFSLSRHGDTNVRTYQRGDRSLTIIPSTLGAATLFDKDLLLYVTSQIIEFRNRNKDKPVSRTVRVDSIDYLVGTDRGDGRKSFEGIIDTLRRLKGTNIETNIPSGNVRQIDGFSLIEDYKILIEKKRTVKKLNSKNKFTSIEIGRVLSFEITLSEWLMNGLMDFQVLTLDRGYFKLDKSIDRRLYEIARWHCRDQPMWKINIDLLAEKVGTTRERFKFRADLRGAIERQPLPDYFIALDKSDTHEFVVFYTRKQPELSRYLISKNLIKWFETLQREIF